MVHNPQALLNEAIRLKRQKDYDRAWALFMSLTEALKGSAFFWSNLAHLALLMERYEEGANSAREALRLKPDSTFARSIFANLLSSLGQEQDALEQFRLRLTQEFNLIDFKRMINLAVKLGSLEAAEEVFGQWREAMNGDPGFFLAMAEGYRRMGQTEKAIALYRKVLELDPDNAFARKQSLAIKLERTSSQAGIRELEMMLRLPENRENVHLMDLLARRLKKEKRYEETAELYKGILAIQPSNLFYQKQLGFTFSKMGNDHAVVQILTPCLEADAKDDFVLRTLVAALKRMGHREEALRIIDRLISKHPSVKRFYGVKKRIDKWPSRT